MIFRTALPKPGANFRLVCFPHAGGNSTSFRSWDARLSDGIEVSVAEMPGRASRYREPCHLTINSASAEFAAAIDALPSKPLALFGHSLGALVAFETALKLEKAARTRVIRLFISGALPPGRRARSGLRSDMTDGELAATLRSLEGTPSEIYSPQLWDIVAPILRADLAMFELYKETPTHKLSCPITAIRSHRDRAVSSHSLNGWQQWTLGDFRTVVLRGGHFYFDEDPTGLIGELENDLH